MIELLVLAAIAYAGARGVESIASTTDRRHDSPAARETVAKVAARGPKDKTKKGSPGPTDPGGTFSAAAPRAARLGGKAAVPFAVLTETGSTMWKAAGEGYRERWPEIRAERRKKMAEKAARKKAAKEKAEAERKAAEALEKAGPPPAHPPKPSGPPATTAEREVFPPRRPDTEGPRSGKPGEPEAEKPDSETAREKELTTPEPDTPHTAPGSAEERVRIAEHQAEAARQEAEDARAREAEAKVKAAEKAEREAKERASAAEARARAAEERARVAETTRAVPAAPEAEKTTPEAEIPAARRHLTVVPNPDQTGDLMSAPATLIPEIRTLDGLMNALTLTRAMCEMRAEEAEAIAADDKALSDLLDRIEGQLNEFEVDDKTREEIALLRESITVQSRTALAYAKAAIDTGAFATAAAGAAYKSHGGIAEAVQSSPIELAAQAGYYEN